MAPRILIFLILLGTKYVSYVKLIANYALTFFGYIISVLASVRNRVTVLVAWPKPPIELV